MTITPEILATILCATTSLFLAAPYWWRTNKWSLPNTDPMAVLKEKEKLLHEQIAVLDFDGSHTSITAEEARASGAARRLELDRLAQQLAHLGGMNRPQTSKVTITTTSVEASRACNDCGHNCQSNDVFCSQCGKNLSNDNDPETDPTPKSSVRTYSGNNIIKFPQLLVVLCVLAFSQVLFAQAEQKEDPAALMPPHEKWETVVVTGSITYQANEQSVPEVLKNHPVKLQVSMGDEVLVEVEKQTDEQGMYSLRNILPHPTLRYVVRATINEVDYTSMPLQVSKGVKSEKLDLLMMPVSLIQNTMKALAEKQNNKSTSLVAGLNDYQFISLSLSALVLALILWRWRSFAVTRKA